MKTILKLALLILIPFLVHAQSASGILSSSRSADWTKAGLPAILPDGETTQNAWTPPVRTQCGSTIAAGALAATINAALIACPPRTYVLLGVGTFSIGSGVIKMGNQNGVTLRGSGADQTKLVFTSGGFINWQSDSLGQHSGNWLSGFTQGTTTITMDAAPTVNGILTLNGMGSNTDNGGVWVCSDPGVCSSEGGVGAQYENHVVTNVTGGGPYTVTISPPIAFSAFASLSSPTAAFTSPPSYGNGLEDLTVESGGVYLAYSYAPWIKGVRFVGATNSGTMINPSTSLNFLVANNYFAQTTIHAYELLDGNTDSFDLVINNILESGASFIQGPGSTDVYAYNVVRDGYNDPGQYYVNNTFSNHTAGYAMNLIEGNEMGNWQEDNIHGTSNLNTFFRNVIYGNDPPFQDVNNTFGLWFAGVSRFENALGNVIGNTTNFSSYKCTSSSCPSGAIVTVGNGNTGITDALSNTSAMLFGNYDTVTAAVRWCGNSGNTGWSTTCSSTSEVPTVLTGAAVPYENAVPATQVLPPSFFLSSRPSWWTVYTNYPTNTTTTTPAYPPIGPDVTGGNINGTGGFPNYAGFANHIPAYIAWKNLPIDTSYQNSYSITASSWAGGTETLTVSSLPAINIAGEFQVTGMSPGGCNGTFMMTHSSATQIQYAVGSDPGCGSSGTFKFPDIRTFSETIYGVPGVMPVAADPSCSQPTGTYTGSVTFTCSTSSGGASLVYTTDGSAPVINPQHGTTYTGAIPISSTTTLKIVAGSGGYSPSNVVTYTYTISGPPTAATPTCVPVGGIFTATQTVNCSVTGGAPTIVYTTDGSTPVISPLHGTVYTTALTVSATTTLKLIAGGTGFTPGAVQTYVYTITLPPAGTPVCSPVGGTYQQPQSVTCSVNIGTSMYYTLDGSTPSVSGTVGTHYTGAITISSTEVLKIVAGDGSHIDGSVASYSYTITQPNNGAAWPLVASAISGTHGACQPCGLSQFCVCTAADGIWMAVNGSQYAQLGTQSVILNGINKRGQSPSFKISGKGVTVQ